MSDIRNLIDIMEDLESDPKSGDILDFEFGDETLVETTVVENRDGDLLIEMQPDAWDYLCRQFTVEAVDSDTMVDENWMSSSKKTPGKESSKPAKKTAEKSSQKKSDKNWPMGTARKEGDKLEEAEYQGRKVSLGKPFLTPDGPKKRSVYVKNPKGNVVKVNFGQKGVKIKKNNPARRKSFRARHGCDNPGPRHRAKFWSCKMW